MSTIRYQTVRSIIEANQGTGPHDSRAVLAAIEVLKKHVYTVGAKLGVLTPYAEPDQANVSVSVPVPLLTTMDEFRQLVELLKARITDSTDADHLDSFRNAELARNKVTGPVLTSGVIIGRKLDKHTWAERAVSMDRALNRLKDRLQGKKRTSTNEERDAFCYAQRQAGRTNKEIQAAVNKQHKWDPLDSEQGVSQAAKRYAERHNMSWPI